MDSDIKRMIYLDSIQYSLSSIYFKQLDNISDDYGINITNEIKPKSISENGFTLKAIRNVFLQPKGGFELSIEYELICLFKQESKDFYNGNINEIEKFIEKRKIEIFNSSDVGNRMSILISQITLAFNNNPIVLPPYINLNSKKQNQ